MTNMSISNNMSTGATIPQAQQQTSKNEDQCQIDTKEKFVEGQHKGIIDADMLKSFSNKVKSEGKNIIEAAKDQFDKIKPEITEFIDDNKKVLGAAGLGVAALSPLGLQTAVGIGVIGGGILLFMGYDYLVKQPEREKFSKDFEAKTMCGYGDTFMRFAGLPDSDIVEAMHINKNKLDPAYDPVATVQRRELGDTFFPGHGSSLNPLELAALMDDAKPFKIHHQK